MLTNRAVAGLTAAMLAVPLSLAAIGPAGARASAASPASLTLPTTATLNYTATPSANDTCTGDCFEWGYMSPIDFDSYTQTANWTLSSQLSLTNSNGILSGSGPLNESGTFSSTGSYGSAGNCPGTTTVASQSTTPGAASASLSAITSTSGAPDLSLSFGSGEGIETVLVSANDCNGPSSYTTTIQSAGGIMLYINQAAPGPITGWTINPNWTPETGGTLATKTISGSVPWPANNPPQADVGTMSATQTWTVVTSPCGSGGGASPQATRSDGRSAASSCGLAITSPPDNSTIAISDPNPNYIVGAQIGSNDRAPALDVLKLKVSGTSAGCSGPVTVNGVAATSSGDDWSAEIPLVALATGGVGQVTLTATANGCSDATSTVTLINLEVTNPAKDGAAEPIANLGDGNAPAMPPLNAKVSVTGYSGDTSGESFGWTLDLRNETVARPSGGGQVGVWSPDGATITGSTTGTGEAWQPGNDQIVGGVGRLTVTASLPGVLDNPVTSFPRWINISGGPLGKAAVLSYLQQSSDAQYAGTISQIFCVESRWQQFNQSAVNGDDGIVQPPIPNVPDGWTPNPGQWQPLYGHPAGVGVAQYDPEAGTAPLDAYWNWQTNAEYGIFVFNQKLAAAPGLAGREQTRLKDRRNAAVAIAKANRKKEGVAGPPTVPPLITVPQLTDQEILWQAVRLYNGGNEFHFNDDYIVSANGLNVDLVSTDTSLPRGVWVGGGDLNSGAGLTGVPPSPAGSWKKGSAGNHYHPMQWEPEGGDNQTYDEQVRVCPQKVPA